MFAVIQFPGSCDDRDMWFAMSSVLAGKCSMVWQQESELPAGTKGVLLPGGFSYGDYLRCGAMAQLSPIMGAVKRFAKRGGPVLGTCNGFQILCEAGLLPGALRRNSQLVFVCDDVHLRVEKRAEPFSSRTEKGAILTLPIKHGEGCFYASEMELGLLEQNGQVLLRYCELDGTISKASNPNGSLGSIAGVLNKEGNVLGLMPHPEHAVEAAFGGTDGIAILGSLLDMARSA